jgi:UDP-glucose:(glucosyl)LPS alpha-1,2-glucosyltransferase
MGGTELMKYGLLEKLGEEFLTDFQIISSRVRNIDETKIRVLWCHDLPEDIENKHLMDRGWTKFHKIVFVSNWQAQRYIERFGIPWSKTIVLQNAIDPVDPESIVKTNDKIKLIYHTTPHRGLNILVPVFEKLAAENPDIHLDVYSSFGIYGWKERDEQYKPLFDQIERHSQMTYHGFKPHSEVIQALSDAHIFAYPSTWVETSCMALIEAMSAKCLCVHPNYGALYETAANWTFMYDFQEETHIHANKLYQTLKTAIDIVSNTPEIIQHKLEGQKAYTDMVYSWEVRKEQWRHVLNAMRNEPRSVYDMVGKSNFVYRTT